MTRKIDLTVNEVPIDLDYFVAGYLDHVAGGIIESLHDTGPIKTLKLTIGSEGQVKINLNNSNVVLGYFPEEIIRSTMAGAVAPLKGVDKPMKSLEMNISR